MVRIFSRRQNCFFCEIEIYSSQATASLSWQRFLSSKSHSTHKSVLTSALMSQPGVTPCCERTYSHVGFKHVNPNYRRRTSFSAFANLYNAGGIPSETLNFWAYVRLALPKFFITFCSFKFYTSAVFYFVFVGLRFLQAWSSTLKVHFISASRAGLGVWFRSLRFDSWLSLVPVSIDITYR